MPHPDEPLSFTQHKLELERIRYIEEVAISRMQVLDDPGYGEWAMREHHRTFVLEFAGRKRTIEHAVEVSYPRDWWQHLKARWFPAWALRRWPVAMTVERVGFSADATALFPEVELFDRGKKVIYAFDRVEWLRSRKEQE